MKKIKKELDKTLIDVNRLNDAVKSLMADISNDSEKAITMLKEHFNGLIHDNIESLSTFSNVGKFEAFINDARSSYVNAIKFIPEDEKTRINTMYDNLYSITIDSVKILQRIFELPYKLKYDGKKLIADAEEIRTKITDNFIVKLTDKQRLYYSLIANIHNAIAAMNEYEHDNSINQFSVHGFAAISNGGFFNKIEPFGYFVNFDEERFINSCRNGIF